jgi:hypothetical protein
MKFKTFFDVIEVKEKKISKSEKWYANREIKKLEISESS